jgi:hypothetical protein
MNRLDRSHAEDAERIRTVELYDYVSDDFSTVDGTETDEEYMEARKDIRRALRAKVILSIRLHYAALCFVYICFISVIVLLVPLLIYVILEVKSRGNQFFSFGALG